VDLRRNKDIDCSSHYVCGKVYGGCKRAHFVDKNCE
jgi:hypothetical protein